MLSCTSFLLEQCVPIKFAKNCLSRDPKCIKIQDSVGREWPGITTWYGGCSYIKNLAELIREKNLDVGDICIFELIKVEELLKVSIFMRKLMWFSLCSLFCYTEK